MIISHSGTSNDGLHAFKIISHSGTSNDGLHAFKIISHSGNSNDGLHAFMIISQLNSSQHEKRFRQKFYRKSNHIFYVRQHFYDKRAVYDIMWKNMVEPDRPQKVI